MRRKKLREVFEMEWLPAPSPGLLKVRRQYRLVESEVWEPNFVLRLEECVFGGKKLHPVLAGKVRV